MLWLCLRFPLLPLEVFTLHKYKGHTEQNSGPHNRPAAVFEQHRMLVCNCSAIAVGIKPGMSLATVQALCFEICIFDRDPRQETDTLQALAYLCYRFTPMVSIQPPDCLLLEIGGCLKLFKGLRQLLITISEAINELGHEYSPGLAGTLKAAVLLSHADPGTRANSDTRTNLNTIASAIETNDLTLSVKPEHSSGSPQSARQNSEQQSCFDDFSGVLLKPDVFEQHLHALPLDVLDCSTRLKTSFRSTGFRCLGDLLRLPGAAIGKRYGKNFLTYLKQLTGELADPQQALELPPEFDSTLHFNDGIISTEMLAFPMKRLLLALCGYLYARQLHCNELQWDMSLVGSKTDVLTLHFAQPHNHLEHFLSMSRLKLENRALSAPVESLNLHVAHLHPAEQYNADFFGQQDSNKQNDTMAVVLDKLRVRLGTNAVYGLNLADSHIPEQAWQTADFINTSGKSSAITTGGNKPRHSLAADLNSALTGLKSDSNPNLSLNGNTAPINRPLWLLQEPEPVQAKGQGLYWHGELELLQGPERIEGNWWQHGICRDYFIARHHNGALHWIYRDRHSARWFVHGLFG